MSEPHIRPAAIDDWPAIERIYREGIRTGHATFQTEEQIPAGEEWFAGKKDGLIFVAVTDASDGRQAVAGWAALAQVSDRCVYAGVCEVSIYVAASRRGQGVGRILLHHLVDASEAAGIWTLQAGIFPENQASIRLHEQAGFRVVGVREKLGKMDEVWRNVTFLERRSPIVN
ncbi:MAG: N-acetyltransferase [Caldilineaceae bacterium]|nr:N-acetyltransferase [Caldilineaceae bacterium]